MNNDLYSLYHLIRFFSFIRFTDSCWEWLGTKWYGYGKFMIYGLINFRAHRYSLLIHGIEIPKNKVVDHICKNKACVNPEHLRVVSHRENTLFNSNGIAAKNAIKTHCKRGHEFNKENTGTNSTGHRSCKPCMTEYQRIRNIKRTELRRSLKIEVLK